VRATLHRAVDRARPCSGDTTCLSRRRRMPKRRRRWAEGSDSPLALSASQNVEGRAWSGKCRHGRPRSSPHVAGRLDDLSSERLDFFDQSVTYQFRPVSQILYSTDLLIRIFLPQSSLLLPRPSSRAFVAGLPPLTNRNGDALQRSNQHEVDR
jgi:hypothetical protein